MNRPSSDTIDHDSEEKVISWKGAVPFLSVHLMCFWVVQTGISWE